MLRLKNTIIGGTRFDKRPEVQHQPCGPICISPIERSCAMKSMVNPRDAFSSPSKPDHLCLYGYVERGNRFIAHDKLRLHDQRSCNAHTLSLSTGELVGIT
jgi:hypothetical protein